MNNQTLIEKLNWDAESKSKDIRDEIATIRVKLEMLEQDIGNTRYYKSSAVALQQSVNALVNGYNDLATIEGIISDLRKVAD